MGSNNHQRDSELVECYSEVIWLYNIPTCKTEKQAWEIQDYRCVKSDSYFYSGVTLDVARSRAEEGQLPEIFIFDVLSLKIQYLNIHTD